MTALHTYPVYGQIADSLRRLWRFRLIAILFRHAYACLAVFTAVLALGVFYLVTAQPKYESNASLIVRFGDQSIPDLNRSATSVLTPADRRETVLSNAAIIESPDLARATIQAIGLANIYPDILANPPQNGSPMNDAVQRFSGNLWVGVGTQNNIITLTFMHPDNRVAQTAIDELIRQFIERQTLVYQNPHTIFLESETENAAKRLDGAQAALSAFEEKWRINNFAQEIEELLKQRGEVDTTLHTAQATRDQAEQRRADLERLIKTIPETQPTPVGGEKFRALDEARDRLAALESKLSQMLTTYRAGSPAVAALNAAITTAIADVKTRSAELEERSSPQANNVYQTIQTDYLRAAADAESSKAPVHILESQLTAIDHRLAALRQVRGPFNDLIRERELAENMYRSLSTQLEDAKVKDSLNRNQISPATVISQPSLAYRPARPRKLVTLVAFAFAATLLAIGSALLLEALRDRIDTAEQVTQELGLPVLAVLARRARTTSVAESRRAA